ncbi:hypothetical protein [Maritalea porphyrae]|uniref:Uncharacterized protein n=1 Tax=Maritalea porphyrae TaxID=880732 RepID=A0ABQ5UTA3_9HYPH|nr:hypothetical protein [Maritalea porphyrae]GLQ17594.1 hypothetical protein GCM10007879_18430 [Maritalea porphyrae]
MIELFHAYVQSKGREYLGGMACVLLAALIVWGGGLFLLLQLT